MTHTFFWLRLAACQNDAYHNDGAGSRKSVTHVSTLGKLKGLVTKKTKISFGSLFTIDCVVALTKFPDRAASRYLRSFAYLHALILYTTIQYALTQALSSCVALPLSSLQIS